MKIKSTALLIIWMVTSVIFSKLASAQEPYVSFQVFYDELSPYGEWVDYPNYGYVWIPDEGPDFVPYSTEGQWLYTNYGWTWASNYEWGWAPFHYGRWDYDNYYGWFWVPDNEWGPAWVSWRSADGYYGWQPMSPGISINLSFGREYDRQNDHWIFVRDRDIERSDIEQYNIDRSDHDRIIRNSSVINNTYNDRRRNTTYVSGPGREDVQRVTGTRVRSIAIQENNQPGQDFRNGRLRIYRPEIQRNNDNERRPAPSRVVNLNEVKRPSERNTPNQSGNVNPSNNTRWNQRRNNENPRYIDNNRGRPAQQQNLIAPDNSRRQQDRVLPENRNNIQPQQQEQQRQQQPPQQQQQQEQQRLQQQQQQEQQKKQEQQQQQSQQQRQQQEEQQRQQQQNQQQQLMQKQQQQPNPAPTNTSRREQRRNAVKTQDNNRNKQPEKSKSERNKRRAE